MRSDICTRLSQRVSRARGHQPIDRARPRGRRLGGIEAALINTILNSPAATEDKVEERLLRLSAPRQALFPRVIQYLMRRLLMLLLVFLSQQGHYFFTVPIARESPLGKENQNVCCFG